MPSGLAIVQSLSATLANITATGDAAVALAGMKAVVAGVGTQISNVRFDDE